MALKVKAGASINHYGDSSAPITEETKLSQSSLEYLKGLYPNDIEGESDAPAAPEAPKQTGKKK